MPDKDKINNYPDVVEGYLYSLNNGNPEGRCCDMIDFRSTKKDATPYPCKILSRQINIEYLAWFLTEDDAKKFSEERGGNNTVISKAQYPFRAVRIDINAKIPMYANIWYVKLVYKNNKELLNPVITERLKKEDQSVIVGNLSTLSDNPRYKKANELLDILEQELQELPKTKIKRSILSFEAFIPFSDILNSKYSKYISSEDVFVPDAIKFFITGVTLSKPSLKNNNIQVRLEFKKNQESKSNIAVDISALVELSKLTKNHDSELLRHNFIDECQAQLNADIHYGPSFSYQEKNAIEIRTTPSDFSNSKTDVKLTLYIDSNKLVCTTDNFWNSGTLYGKSDLLSQALSKVYYPLFPKNAGNTFNEYLSNLNAIAQKLITKSNTLTYIKVSELAED